MIIRNKFRFINAAIAIGALAFCSNVFANATLSLATSASTERYLPNDIAQVNVSFSPETSGMSNYAIQYDVTYSPLLVEPGIPALGYSLLPSNDSVYKVRTSIVSPGKLRVVIVPERKNNSTSFDSLRSGTMLSIPFTVLALPEGIQTQTAVSISSTIASDSSGWITSSESNNVTVANSTQILLASYRTCNEGSIVYMAEDASHAEGATVVYATLNNGEETGVRRDINKDGVCDSYAVANNADSDDDGISDLVELTYDFLNPYDPTDADLDSDGDGLTNRYEIANGSEPNTFNVPDTDSDGMDDLFELTFGLNPLDASDKNSDLDGDGLNNLLEYSLGSLIDVNDSDNDGMKEKFEHDYGFPLADTLVDGDSNGVLCATAESSALNGTGPTNDKDCDGLTNQQEHDLASNPLLIDTDKDNVADLEEYTTGRSVTVNEPALMAIIQGLLL